MNKREMIKASGQRLRDGTSDVVVDICGIKLHVRYSACQGEVTSAELLNPTSGVNLVPLLHPRVLEELDKAAAWSHNIDK